VLASIFDDLDRIQHMFRRDRPKVVQDWYQRLDGFIGRVNAYLEKQNGKKLHLLVMSDHGFTDFRYKVHVNHWLLENGYLAMQEGKTEANLASVDWAKTKAYSIGLNSLYINLKGREGHGVVPLEQVEDLATELKDKLMKWMGPDGQPVFSNVQLRHEAFSGPLLRFGPDLNLGCSSGYRASSETGSANGKRPLSKRITITGVQTTASTQTWFPVYCSPARD